MNASETSVRAPMQPAAPAAPPAPNAVPNAASSPAAAELARARAEVDRLQQEIGTMRGGEGTPAIAGGEEQTTSVTTSADGRTTTINENGQITRIVTGEDGQVTITQGGKTETVGGPGAEAIAQLARNQAHTAPPAFEDHNTDDIPDEVIPLVATVFGLVAATIVLTPLTRAFGRRMDRKNTAPAGAPPEVTMRLDRIEQAIETIAVEVERVSEAQRYSAKLLTERLPDASARALHNAEAIR